MNMKNDVCFQFSFSCPHCNEVIISKIDTMGECGQCPKCSQSIIFQPSGQCFEGLNLKQKKAVASVDGIIRLVAGAGTGKTRVLIHRLAHLILDVGIPLEDILSVTFTNKAAGVMKKRAKFFLGNSCAFRISTFHGFCHELLKEDIHYVNFPLSFMIMDTEDQKQILKEIYEEFGIEGKLYSYKQAIRDITLFKHHNYTKYVPYLTRANLLQTDYFFPNETCSINEKVINGYLLKQRKNYILDYDDLILFAIYILSNFLEVKTKWNDRIRFIQVDEFQDVNLSQWTLLTLLLGENKNLFVVGDPDQNIYSWRGACLRIFLGLDDFASRINQKFIDLVLDDNYRSFQSILDISNQMIAHNEERIHKDLHAIQGQNGKKPIYFHAKDNIEETNWIVSQIQTMTIDSSIQYKDISILFRGIASTRAVEEVFLKKQIPYRIINGLGFFERKEIKDALAYLRLIVAGDDLSFKRIINEPPRGIGKTRIKFLEKYAEEHHISLWQAFCRNADTGLFSRASIVSGMPKVQGQQKYMYTPLFPAELVEIIQQLAVSINKMTLSDILVEVLTKTGYEAYVLQSGDNERKDNLNELLIGIVEREKEAQERVDIRDYLNEIAIYAEKKENESENSVKMMTIHAAKGQEFPFVFVPFFNENILPSCKCRTKQEIEEERRVAYVAFTRAEKQLFISNSDGNQLEHYLLPSRFLIEISQNLLHIDGTLPVAYWEESSKKIQKLIERTSYNLSVGDFVCHPQFGTGEVIEIKDNVCTVNFFQRKAMRVQTAFLTKTEHNLQLFPEKLPKRIESTFDDEIPF